MTDLAPDPPASSSQLVGVQDGVQRACAIGLSAFTLQGLTVAVAGWALYPRWWLAVVGPALLVAVGALIASCLRGRSSVVTRVGTAAVVAAGSVLTAIATAETVQEIGNAVFPVVVAMVMLLALLDHPALALPCGAVLAGTHVVAVSTTRPVDPADVAVVTMIMAALLVASAAAGQLVARTATAADHARTRLVRAVAADRAAAASRADRRERERELHDGVLSTLTAIARSSLTDSETLRSRCAADARYLRSLGHAVADEVPDPDLLGELATIARDASHERFRVVVEPARAPVDLPAAAVRALAGASREAVANAALHSGACEMTVQVRTVADRLTIELVDAGSGIGPPPDHPGLGIRGSILERMADVGGWAAVTHQPGVGTTVVLRWPA